MDVYETLRRFVATEDADELHELADAYNEWVNRDGFRVRVSYQVSQTGYCGTKIVHGLRSNGKLVVSYPMSDNRQAINRTDVIAINGESVGESW